MQNSEQEPTQSSYNAEDWLDKATRGALLEAMRKARERRIAQKTT